MSQIGVRALQTRIFELGEDLASFVQTEVEESIKNINVLDGSILAVTSKIVSLAERSVVSKKGISKKDLVQREADLFFGEIGYGCFLTAKEGLLIPSAGIDESNANGDYYILYPEVPFRSAALLRNKLIDVWKINNLGILFTDSHTTPLRRGVTGIALAHAGFRGVINKIGEPDLFGVPLKMTQINVADALAASAVYCMGEAAESCPLALLQSGVEFKSGDDWEVTKQECRIDPEHDLYRPFLTKISRQ